MHLVLSHTPTPHQRKLNKRLSLFAARKGTSVSEQLETALDMWLTWHEQRQDDIDACAAMSNATD
jgi:hypothetical protein